MKNLNKISESNDAISLSYDLLAQEELNILIFFATYFTQLLSNKVVLSEPLKTPKFVIDVKNNQVYASQRFFIKTLLANKSYLHLNQFLTSLVVNSTNSNQKPIDLLFKDTAKSFYIRQIFNISDQIIPKYLFINDYLNIDFYDVDLTKLNADMNDNGLSIMEQVLIIVRVFSMTNDEVLEKIQSIEKTLLKNLTASKKFFFRQGIGLNDPIMLNLNRFEKNFS